MESAISSLLFYLFAAAAIICAFGVVAFRNPVTSAMNMALCFGFTAAVFFGLGAQFLGIVQLIVYAGAILVLFLFIIMMLDVKVEEKTRASLPLAFVAVIIAGIFAGMITNVALSLPGAREGSCPARLLCQSVGELGLSSEADGTSACAASCTQACAQTEAQAGVQACAQTGAQTGTQAGAQPCAGTCAPQKAAAPGAYGAALPKLRPDVAAQKLDAGLSAEKAACATSFPDTRLLGQCLFTRYNIPFVILGFALLAGTVGSVALSRKLRKD